MQTPSNQGFYRQGTRLKAKAGAALNIVFTDIKDSAGALVDLTGADVEMVLSISEPQPTTTNPGAPAFQYASDNEITVSANQILIEIPAASTKLYAQAQYFYDIFLRMPLADPQILASGILYVEGSVIREMTL